jgi:hypothetical protein
MPWVARQAHRALTMLMSRLSRNTSAHRELLPVATLGDDGGGPCHGQIAPGFPLRQLFAPLAAQLFCHLPKAGVGGGVMGQVAV